LSSTLREKLVSLLGNDAVVSNNRMGEYAIDGLVPHAVVRPTSREAIAEVLRWASAEKLAVAPRGGGTKMSLGNVPSSLDLVVDLSHYNRLLDYQPADLTATVEAGMPLAAFQRELSQGGNLASLEAPAAVRATIGGILAANSSGPLRHSYGPARDWLIGISVVGPDGGETRAGGKVVKNVTGYDLNKLYTGSLGTLGIIVEATFKLAPLPTDSGALVAVFSSVPEAITEARNLLAQVYAPQGVHVVNARTANRLDLPVTVPTDGGCVIAFCSGRPRAVQRRLAESADFVRERGSAPLERLDQPSGAVLLSRLNDLGWSVGTIPQLGLKINVSPSLVATVVATVVADAITWLQDAGIGPPGILADAGYGSLNLFWWDEDALPLSGVIETIARYRGAAGESGGSVIIEHCPLPVKRQVDVWGGPSVEVELMRRIKHNFDPLGTLNPGRFMGRL
jgi:glycolate oxidase FAD binding subunit